MKNPRWSALSDGLKSYSVELRSRKESAKAILEHDLSLLEKEIHSLKSRWESSKSNTDMSDEGMSGIDLFLSECDDLVQRKKILNTNCTCLDMRSKSSSSLEDLFIDIMRYSDAKEAMKEFNKELTEMHKMNWKDLDLKCFKEFSNRWKLRIEDFPATTLSKKILMRTASIDKVLPVLNYCCEDFYNQEHRVELFYEILGVPRNITMKNINVREIIEASNNLSLPETITSLQNLQTRYVDSSFWFLFYGVWLMLTISIINLELINKGRKRKIHYVNH